MTQPSVLVLIDRNITDYSALPRTFERALEKLGHKVESVHFQVPIRIFRIFDTFFPFLNRSFLASSQRRVIDQVLRSECELVLVVKGFFILDTTVEELKRNGKIVVCYNPDDPFNPKSGSANRIMRAAIRSYDNYFIWSHDLIEPIRKMGCPNVHYLPFAVDNDIIKPVSTQNGAIHQDMHVSFIGGADEKRIKFIKSLRRKLDTKLDMSVFGNEWPEIAGVYGINYNS